VSVSALSKRGIVVVFDTNMLLLAVQKPLDVFSEVGRVLNAAFKPVILRSTLDELIHLAERGRPKERAESRLALELAKKCEVIDFEFPGDADSAIIEYARKHSVVVATNDIALRRSLRKLGVPVIFLRGFDHLELEGEVY